MRNIINALVLMAVVACQPDVRVVSHSSDVPRLSPDYAGVTVPCNIAPLCFSVEGIDEAALIVKGGNDSICMTTSDGNFNLPDDQWHSLLDGNKDKALTLTVCRKTDGGWQALAPVNVYVSADSIDPYVVYRRIQPGYGLWDRMGIYQRNLETYDEEPVYENREGSGNCVNCHSFNQGNPEQWQLHVRRNHKGTYVVSNGQTKNISQQSMGVEKPVTYVYPSWHPGGRYIAYSSNKTFFHIHTADKNRWEVMDDGSDVMVVDSETGSVVKSPLLSASDRYETFPCFSPDGRWLYYSTAAAVDTLVRQYDKVHYSICRIPFDATRATFGNAVDTIHSISGQSLYMPRLSPDGAWLSCVRSAYGNFGVCHRDATLSIKSLRDAAAPAVSPQGNASWHSWSSNSRWIVFSSKRDDGQYTRLYFMHIDKKGRCTKAFVMPQRNARNYYDMMMDAYNIPELVKGRVGRFEL